jgi:hypothetical protein
MLHHRGGETPGGFVHEEPRRPERSTFSITSDTVSIPLGIKKIRRKSNVGFVVRECRFAGDWLCNARFKPS